MAYTDHLTGLPNRALLFKELGAPSDEMRCLLVLDLDGFKAVNDVAGHEAGDHLLVEMARRLHTVVREDDLVARLGGDEFAIIVTGGMIEAKDVAQRVVDALGMPHRTGEWAFAVGASVGVAPLGAAGGQASFRAADEALRAAKAAGKGCVRLADDQTPPAGPVSVADLDALATEGAFEVRVNATTTPDGRIAWLHAVPTWSHPDHPKARGSDLWSLAERQGKAGQLQTWLLHEACRVVAGLADERVGVTVSLPAGLATADGLASDVGDALSVAGLAADRLMLLFSEENLLTASAALVPELETVRRAGVRLCLDNYGMGRSLFALLARVPLDVVRVDVAALAARDGTERAVQVLSAILRTTKDFGITAIAGGINTPALHAAALASGVQLLAGRWQPTDLSTDDVAALVAVPAS
jgi:diguanylate cyclase (GGDEF)-like protein